VLSSYLFFGLPNKKKTIYYLSPRPVFLVSRQLRQFILLYAFGKKLTHTNTHFCIYEIPFLYLRPDSLGISAPKMCPNETQVTIPRLMTRFRFPQTGGV